MIKNIRGFTLIELLVSISIIGIISTISIVNYRKGTSSGQLITVSQDIVSETRKIQGYAMGLKEFNGVFSNGGWGIRFERNSPDYILFSDLVSDQKYKPVDNELFSEQSFSLNGDVFVSDIDLGGGTYNYFYLVYYPPDPSVYMGVSNSPTDNTLSNTSVDTGYITIANNRGETKTIEFNKFGLVDVD